MRAHPAADLRAFQIRQAEIEHDQVGRRVGDRLDRLDARADHVHVVASRPQQRRDRALNRHVVVHQQDPGGAVHFTSAGHDDREAHAAVAGSSRRQIRPRSTARTPLAIARPMPVPDRRSLHVRPAIEALEHVRQIGFGDAGAAIAHGNGQPVGADRRAHLDRRAGRRVLRGVLEQLRRARRRSAADRAAPAGRRRPRRRTARPRSDGSTRLRAASMISDGDTQRVSCGDRAGVDARHLEDVLEQARQPVDLGEDQVALLAPLLLVGPRGLEVARRDPDRGQRRPQIVAERGEQRRLQRLALAREIGRLALVEELRPLDRDRGEAGDGVERRRLRSAGRRPPAGRSAGRRAAAARIAPSGAPGARLLPLLDLAIDGRQLARDRASAAAGRPRRRATRSRAARRSPRSRNRSGAR